MSLRVTLFQISIGILLFIHCVKSERSFGVSCSKRKDCNVEAGLRCLKGFCRCKNPDAQVFSEKLGTCAIKVGRRCGGSENGDQGNLTTTAIEIEPVSQICVENAECRKLKLRNWCRCREGFISNVQGTGCVKASKYDEKCSADKEPCDKRSGTECIGGNCLCPFGNHQYFDEHEKACVSFANKNCSIPKISRCVRNAECLNVQLRTGYTTEDGVKKIHSKTVTQCLCVTGFAENSDGHCMGMAESECSNSQPCNSEAHLVCVDGKCGCRNPLYEIIDKNSGSCLKLVGGSCQINGEGMQCVKNSECKNETCKCRVGYIETSKKTCLLGYQQNCQAHECSTKSGLACINGICDCFDSHLVFDKDSNACVGLSSSSGSSASIETFSQE